MRTLRRGFHIRFAEISHPKTIVCLLCGATGTNGEIFSSVGKVARSPSTVLLFFSMACFLRELGIRKREGDVHGRVPEAPSGRSDLGGSQNRGRTARAQRELGRRCASPGPAELLDANPRRRREAGRTTAAAASQQGFFSRRRSIRSRRSGRTRGGTRTWRRCERSCEGSKSLSLHRLPPRAATQRRQYRASAASGIAPKSR